MSEDIIIPEDITEAQDYPPLGPAYFVAQRVTRRAMYGFAEEHAKEVTDEVVSLISDKLWDSIQRSLWSDTELNIEHQFWQTVDASVRALLTGERWALERYALSGRYDADAVRRSVAKHIPQELQDMRVADLEKEVKDLKDLVAVLREQQRY